MNASVEFQWFLQDLCNYRCPYCIVSGELRDTRPWLVNEHGPDAWIAAWKRVYEKHGYCWVRMTGGEPTIVPGFLDMISKMSQWHGISFDTNLTWSMDQLKTFCDRMPADRVSLDISFHPHEATVDSIIEKALYLRERKIQHVCRLVAFPPLLPRIEGFRRRFEDAGLKFIVNPFQGLHEGKSYPESYGDADRQVMSGIVETFRAGPEADREQPFFVDHLMNMHARSPLGKLCRSGQVYCRVMHDGKVYRCQPYESRQWEPLGNLLEESFALRAQPTACRSTWCEFEYKYVLEP